MTANLFSRRRLMLAAGAGLLASPALASAPKKAHVAPAATTGAAATPTVSQVVVEAPLTPEQAMTRLMAGNARYVAAKATHPNGDAQRRRLVAGGERPFATILACADSRVAPELVFDQGLGDLFVVRVAGNVVDDAVLASIEHSVIHLGSPLIMVLGHERCGAVAAAAEALDGHPADEDKDTKIGALAALIAPAVHAVPVGAPDKIDAAVSLNASHAAVEIFAGSKPLRNRVLAGRLKIVAARYDLDEGKVAPAKARAEI
ncbi:carbonic anhydrase [Phenylobacterium deserti]|uniref:carbonic anhydrase n=1 Tax=Phenylobacterium deserti TaxID=1914756 RepID=A0A328ADC5_9CAUL|nr:carbonic anhydrase [Phenylobacterium deserti]RAK52507.1 carbonic anhydrase [Phenylobacterium deserti]